MIVKVCCIRSIDEAMTAIRLGASAIGLVSEMPSGPGPIPDRLIAEIANAIPPCTATFLLTSKQDIPSIVDQLRRFPVSTVQLCDELIDGSIEDLRAEVPSVRIVPVVHVTGEEAVHKALQMQTFADALLLDSGAPLAKRKRLGGTGEVHDWSISRRIRERVHVPVYLAGGLKPENVSRAIQQVGPWAVDVCSGVRTDGFLDEQKLTRFIESAKLAGTERPPPGAT